MTNIEYAELLDYVSEKSNMLDSVNVYKVHSSYNPKTNEIDKVTLKVNYTKDGKPLPEIISRKVPKNVVLQRSVQFRGSNCSVEEIKDWIDDFMNQKQEEYNGD